MTGIESLSKKLLPLTEQITHHEVYSKISSLPHLRLFMEQHVFAVWDFMCLLKELFRKIVSTSAPWFPSKDALSANLISSILVEEEGDLAEDGLSYMSHYEMYLKAMNDIGANTTHINRLLSLLKENHSIQDAIALIPIRTGTKNFVLTTFDFFQLEVHEIAATFVFGREGITASMFLPILKQIETTLDSSDKTNFSTLIYYLKRHIELDAGEHYHKASKMLDNLIGNDVQKLQKAEIAATQALMARIHFLTDIQKSFSSLR